MSVRINDVGGQRSNEDGMKNIFLRTSFEKMFMAVFYAHMKEKHNDNIKLENYGVDNSGSFISDEEAKFIGKKMGDPDWKLSIGNKSWLLEAMVHSEKYSISSFKESKLKRCIEKDASIIVLRENYYDLYRPSLIDEILNKWESVVLTKQGGNVGRVLEKFEMTDLIKEKKLIREYWNESAKIELEKIKTTIFK